MIRERTIETVVERVNIVDVISDYATLKKRGAQYTCSCPFHEDRSPSMAVSAAKGLWHCFSCGRGGTTVDFIMEREGVTFPEAIRLLAGRMNIVVEETGQNEITAREKEEYLHREGILIILQAAREFYFERIKDNTAAAKAARAYVSHRWGKGRSDNQRPLAPANLRGGTLNATLGSVGTDKNASEPLALPENLGHTPPSQSDTSPTLGEDLRENGYAETLKIGYAPNEWTAFYDYATAKGYSVAYMEDAGLIKKSSRGNYIDFFRDRIMIPITDRHGRVTGFTARTMEQDGDQPKYINTPSTQVFDKSRTLFGLQVARQKGCQEGRMYVVEGGPDALHMQQIGVENTVAPLGTALTDAHLDILKSILRQDGATLTFIPDNDTPRKGQKHAPGTAAVMKSGRMAMAHGFRVTVVEIPTDENDAKRDADSYFENRQMLDLLDEEDFTEWYARHTLEGVKEGSERSAAIKDVCSLLALVGDEYARESLLGRLTEIYKQKQAWRNGLRAAMADKKKQDAQRVSAAADVDLLERYGFYKKGNRFYSPEGQEWSNFVIEPLFHIKDVNNSRRIYRMKNCEGEVATLEMREEDLYSLLGFRTRVGSMGNFRWKADMKELLKLGDYLYDQTETAQEIKQLGWDKKRGFWAWGNAILTPEGQVEMVDKNGIARLSKKDEEGRSAASDNYYFPAQSVIYDALDNTMKFEREFIFTESHSSISLNALLLMMTDVFGDNARVSILYMMATLFRDVVMSKSKNFPILNLFGPKGSGKSQLGYQLMAFFIKSATPVNIIQSTIPGLSASLARSSNALCHIDEYTNTIDPAKVELLKAIYDGVGRTRYSMEIKNKTETTPIDCGVILSGQEMPTLDIALLSRCIFLSFDKTVHTYEETKRFNELASISAMGFCHLTNEILRQRSLFVSSYSHHLNFVSEDLQEGMKGLQVEDRIWRNWAVLLATFRILREPLHLSWTYEDVKALILRGILRQNKECSQGNELANFWTIFAYMAGEGMIQRECDYKLVEKRDIKTDHTIRQYKEDKLILMIRPARIILQYKKASRMLDARSISERSIRYYLSTCDGYLGKKTGSERFRQMKDGVPMREKVGGSWADLYTFDHPLCFEYDRLQELYNLNIRSYYLMEQTGDEVPEEKMPF